MLLTHGWLYEFVHFESYKNIRFLEKINTEAPLITLSLAQT